MQQIQHWGPTDLSRHRAQFRPPGDLVPGDMDTPVIRAVWIRRRTFPFAVIQIQCNLLLAHHSIFQGLVLWNIKTPLNYYIIIIIIIIIVVVVVVVVAV